MFAIGTVHGSQWLPDCAWDELSDRFLVTWTDNRKGNESFNSDVFGQLIDTNGLQVSGEISVSTGTGDQSWEQVACNSIRDECLVVWHDRRTFDDTA